MPLMTFNVNGKVFYKKIIVSLRDLFERGGLCLAFFGLCGIPRTT